MGKKHRAILLVMTFNTWLNLFLGFEERNYEEALLVVINFGAFLIY